MATNAANGLIPPGRLWFGFATTACAWVTLGCTDIVIAWCACTHQQEFGVPPEHLAEHALVVALGALMFCVSAAAGITSYRNWRQVTISESLFATPALERQEFMAMLGVIVSITLGLGILFLSLPPFFLSLCWRAH